jgi:hypothetical protein
MCFLRAVQLAAHHPLRMKKTLFSRPMANATPYGETSASVGKALIRAGLTRYLGRETLIKYWLTPHASTRGTRARQWLPYTPTPLHPCVS